MTEAIVSTTWLKENLGRENFIILDASPKSKITGTESSFKGKQIPSARLFKIKENFSDQGSEMPNTLPSPKQFEQECRKLGINKNSKIVVYDNLGVYSAPRVWWMFKTMGHQDISVLNGGLPEWINAGFDVVDKQEEKYDLGNFEANFDPSNVKSYEDVLKNSLENKFLVVDARSSGRFEGTAPEPRAHLQSGHIPNSVNIPYQDVLDNGKFKTKEELNSLFDSKTKEGQALTFSCGSGLTACIVLLASELINKEGSSIYDGSWTEWAELQGLKIAKT